MTNSRLSLYLEKSASARSRTGVKASGSAKVRIPNHLLTTILALPAGYGMYRALDDILKKKRER